MYSLGRAHLYPPPSTLLCLFAVAATCMCREGFYSAHRDPNAEIFFFCNVEAPAPFFNVGKTAIRIISV